MVAPVAVEIPIINISGYLSGDVQAKSRIVDGFRNACENQGFLQVVGHSVPADLQSRFMASLAEFFALPVSEKEKIAKANRNVIGVTNASAARSLTNLTRTRQQTRKKASLFEHIVLSAVSFRGPTNGPKILRSLKRFTWNTSIPLMSSLRNCSGSWPFRLT